MKNKFSIFSIIVLVLLIGLTAVVYAAETYPGTEEAVLPRDATEDTPTASNLTVTITKPSSTTEFKDVQGATIEGTAISSDNTTTVVKVEVFITIKFSLKYKDLPTPISKYTTFHYPAKNTGTNYTTWVTVNALPSDLLTNETNILAGREAEFEAAISEATGKNVSLEDVEIVIDEVKISARAYLDKTEADAHLWNHASITLKEPDKPWYLKALEKAPAALKGLWDKYGTTILTIIGINFVIGIIVGFLFKKILKIAIVIAIILFLVWYFFGVTFVDFNTVKEAAAPWLMRLAQLLPLSIGLIIGLIIGFKIGKK